MSNLGVTPVAVGQTSFGLGLSSQPIREGSTQSPRSSPLLFPRTSQFDDELVRSASRRMSSLITPAIQAEIDLDSNTPYETAVVLPRRSELVLPVIASTEQQAAVQPSSSVSTTSQVLSLLQSSPPLASPKPKSSAIKTSKNTSSVALKPVPSPSPRLKALSIKQQSEALPKPPPRKNHSTNRPISLPPKSVTIAKQKSPTTNPSVEPKWMSKLNSLSDLLSDPAAVLFFERFAKSSFAAENLYALQALDLFLKNDLEGLDDFLHRINPPSVTSSFPFVPPTEAELHLASLSDARVKPITEEERRTLDAARWIYDIFFKFDAPFWTCLEDGTMVQLLKDLKKNRALKGDEFGKARTQVFASVQSTIFVNFVNQVHRDPTAYLGDSERRHLSDFGTRLYRDSLDSIDYDASTVDAGEVNTPSSTATSTVASTGNGQRNAKSLKVTTSRRSSLMQRLFARSSLKAKPSVDEEDGEVYRTYDMEEHV